MTDYIRDGHRFDLRVEQGFIIGHIECPGHGRCRAWVKPEPTPSSNEPRGEGFCSIVQLVGDVGWQEFAECQHKTDGEYLTVELPCEIEWVADGLADGWDEDWELYWRPIRTAASNMRQGLNALLRYFPAADLVRIVNQNDTLQDIFASAPPPPFEHAQPHDPGPWTTVDLVLAGKPLRLAIWNQTGHVYRVGEDGAVEDDPFIEVKTQ